MNVIIRTSIDHVDAKTIVVYFLSNASSFRGPDAKRIKAELKSLIK